MIGTLSSTTTPDQSGPDSNGNKEIFHPVKSFRASTSPIKDTPFLGVSLTYIDQGENKTIDELDHTKKE